MINSSLIPTAVLNSFIPTFFPLHPTISNFTSALQDGTFVGALGDERRRHADHGRVLHRVRVPGGARDQPVPVPRAHELRDRGAGHPNAAGRGLFIAQYKMMSELHLLDTVIAVSIIYVAAVVPFTIWMLRGFVAGYPRRPRGGGDGGWAEPIRRLHADHLPLLAPGLVASGVYAFLQAWNEFTVALVLLPSEASQTLPLWLRGFVMASATRETDWGAVMAASTLVAIPVIVFFLIVQGRLTSGLVSGAVKG